jgi:hypothetical protein
VTLRARWWMAVVPAAALGCDDPKPCNTALRDDESFTVEVLSKVDPTGGERPSYIKEGTPPCSAVDPVELGASFNLTLDNRDERPSGGDVCYDFVCPADFPSAAAASSVSVGKYGGTALICSNGQAKVELQPACEAQRYVALYERKAGADLVGQPDGEGRTPVTLVRALMITPDLPCSEPPAEFPNALSTSSYFCYDQWNVQLTRTGK